MVLLCCGACIGCATPQRRTFTRAALQSEVARRVPATAVDKIAIPYVVEAEDIERATWLLRAYSTTEQRAAALIEALFDAEGFNLRYASAATATASQTLRAGEGNCLSLASTLVGLARGLGLRAYYVDVSHLTEEVIDHSGLLVRSGHVSAVIRTEVGYVGLDFGRGRVHYRGWRGIDDMEAVAHFHNNRGYELIRTAIDEGKPIPWQQASEQFWLATRVEPKFQRAWNNLGVALARLGFVVEAIRSYREAIVRDPHLVSSYRNLGNLYFRQGLHEEAVSLLNAAAAIAPDDANIHFERARVLLEVGRRGEAVHALKRAVKLSSTHARARALLNSLTHST